MKLIADLSKEELNKLVEDMGEKKFRAKQLETAVYEGKSLNDITNLPKSFKEKLKDYELTGVSVLEKFVSVDGTVKYLFKLNDNALIEGVVMSYKHGKTICISTQVGCRMNCSFCASGIDGLVRNLTAGEMLGQVVVSNNDLGGTLSKREITNIVLMGSGEPLDNFDEVVKFLNLVNNEKGINIGYRHISLSTCGLVKNIYKLADLNIQINLTISLHAPFDDIRSEIMPVNNAYSINEVIKASKYYFEKTKRRVIFEYALINGVNDSDACANKLSRLVKGFPSHINLINLNYVKEKNLKRSTKIEEFKEKLEKNNCSVTIRRVMGSDIEGACGQLRRRYLENNE